MKNIIRSERGSAAASYAAILFLAAATVLISLCILGPGLVQKQTGDAVGNTNTTAHRLLEDTQAELNAMAEDVASDIVGNAEATFLEACNEGCEVMYGSGSSLASTEDLSNCYTFCQDNK